MATLSLDSIRVVLVNHGAIGMRNACYDMFAIVVFARHFLNGTGQPTIVRYRIDTDERTYFDTIDFHFYPLDFIDSLNGWACGPRGVLDLRGHVS